MTRGQVAFAAIVILVLHAAWAQIQRGNASTELLAAKDSIAILEPLADSLASVESRHAVEAAAVEARHADSVAVWARRLRAASARVVDASAVYDSIEAEILADADERMTGLVNRLTTAHDAALAASAEALATETSAREASDARASIWKALAEERLRGWDNEKALRIQESLRADAAEVLAHPPLSLRLVKGAPWLALGAGAVLLATR